MQWATNGSPDVDGTWALQSRISKTDEKLAYRLSLARGLNSASLAVSRW